MIPVNEPTLFSATLTPHRSLGGGVVRAVMLAVAGISVIAGALFLALGAWPVSGFFGLDAALVCWAFQASCRTARACEEVLVTASALKVRKISHRGQAAEWTLNPLWVKLDSETDTDYGMRRLALVSHGRLLPIATFLPPQEMESFATTLAAALAEAKRGPTWTNFV
jgi:uncharacterized membrane protein